MKPTSLKKTATKTRYLLMLSAALLTSACQANDKATRPANEVNESLKTVLNELDQNQVIQTEDCAIISSQNWSAKIGVDDSSQSMLFIKGDIELPNPGYAVTFQEGPANLSLPPIQHFYIKTERLSGFHIQVITPMTLEHSSPASADGYRSVVIHCGEQTFATIDNVKPK